MDNINNNNYDTFIFHDNCMDGLTAVAVALQNYLTPNGVDSEVRIIPATHGTAIDINKLKGKRVCFLDFSVKADVMLDILDVAKHVTVMDHHISVLKELSDIDHPNFNYIYHSDLSGAQIAWKEFIGKEEPYFIRLIGDRDLWTKKYEDSKILNIALKVEEYDIDDMVPLVTELVHLSDRPDNHLIGETATLLQAGANYQKYHDKIVRDIASQSYESTLDDGTVVRKVNCGHGFVSDVGEYLYTVYGGVAWLFSVGESQVYNSLRVGPDCDYDGAAYAKSKGGGGHTKACGWVESTVN